MSSLTAYTISESVTEYIVAEHRAAKAYVVLK